VKTVATQRVVGADRLPWPSVVLTPAGDEMSQFSMTAWRRLLLANEIRGISETKIAKLNKTGGISFATPPSVQKMIARATGLLRANKFDQSVLQIIAAERRLIRERRKFHAALAARESPVPANETAA
jgi:hypothetical protein